MNILSFELKKILMTPIMIIMCVVCLIFNIFLIASYYFSYEDTGLINEIYGVIDELGINLNEKSDELSEMENGEEYIEYSYALAVNNAATLYDDLDMIEIKNFKEELLSYEPTGSYKEFIDSNYEKLQDRVDEIIDTGEYNYSFYPGTWCEIFGFLFGTLLKAIALEMVIIVVFYSLFLMDYERINGMQDLALTSKTGKNIIRKKSIFGMVSGIITGIVIMNFSLAIFFSLVPFKELWNVPVSSGLVAETRSILYYPFITFWQLSIFQYLILSICVIIILALIIGLISSSIQIMIQNSYFSVLIVVLLCLSMFLLPFYIVTEGFLDTIIRMNPSTLWNMCGGWFIENDICICFAGNEFITEICWLAIGGLLFYFSWRSLKKRDVL